MYIDNFRVLIALTLALLTSPTLADDCATVKSAMLNSGHTPKSVLIAKTDGQDGKWYAMNIAIKDLNDDLSGVLACHSGVGESVGGESTTVYEVHMNLGGSIGDSRVWVSSKNLILKSEQVIAGAHYTTEYDFGHVTPPANAIPMGGR
jgi:hypothetical protein